MAPRIGLRHWIFARTKCKKDPYSHARAAALFARATPAYVPHLYYFTTHRASDGARRPSTTVTRSMSTLLCKFSPRAHFFRQHCPSRFGRNSPELPDSKHTTLGTGGFAKKKTKDANNILQGISICPASRTSRNWDLNCWCPGLCTLG